MKRVLLVLLSAIMLIAGGALVALSAWIYAAFGTDGVASASLGRITSATPSSAVVIDVDTAHVRIPVLPVRGSTTLRVQSITGGSILAGSHDGTSVDSLLGAREFDAAYRNSGQWVLTHVPGSADQAASPSTAWLNLPDWIRTGPEVDVSVIDGETVLIANADGTTGIDVEARLQFSAPRAPQAALALVLSGGVLVLGGLALAFSAIWLMRRRPDADTP